MIYLLLILGLFFGIPVQQHVSPPAGPDNNRYTPRVYQADQSGWIRPKSASDPLVWGRPEGLVFGLPSEGGIRGPRGLIRVGVLSSTGTAHLVNFFAVEPVTQGPGPRHLRMGYSELEMSELDAQKRGKRMWTDNHAGELETSGSREALSVRIEVEPFSANGARVYVIATMFSDKPHEIQLTVHHHAESQPIEELTLTATMGNKARLRQLWLKDEIVDSRTLYVGYDGNEFVEKRIYPLSEMLTWKGDPIVLATSDEKDPASVHIAQRPSWNYTAHRMTQYWRVPAEDVKPNLHVRVNGRRVYWAGTIPIPGGVSYENIELRQTYTPGQRFIFGMLPVEPHDFEPAIEHLAPAPEFID